jgi:hypothetical protein
MLRIQNLIDNLDKYWRLNALLEVLEKLRDRLFKTRPDSWPSVRRLSPFASKLRATLRTALALPWNADASGKAKITEAAMAHLFDWPITYHQVVEPRVLLRALPSHPWVRKLMYSTHLTQRHFESNESVTFGFWVPLGSLHSRMQTPRHNQPSYHSSSTTSSTLEYLTIGQDPWREPDRRRSRLSQSRVSDRTLPKHTNEISVEKVINLWDYFFQFGTVGEYHRDLISMFSRSIWKYSLLVYLVYGQASTHISCRQSCRPIVWSLEHALHACNQDLQSTTRPGHGHATYDISEEPVVCRMSTCLASNKYRVRFRRRDKTKLNTSKQNKNNNQTSLATRVWCFGSAWFIKWIGDRWWWWWIR